MEKGFVKIFSPEKSGKRLKIPTCFTYYKNEKLPKKIYLRDRFGNMWPIGVNKIGGNFYFQYGWEKFIEDNTIEVGDFLIFDYDGNRIFDFKLLGRTKCEKKGVGGLKLTVKEEEGEEMGVEHQKSAEPKGKNWASDNFNSSSSDDNDVEYIGEEDDDEDEEYKETKKVPCHAEEEEEEQEDDEDEEEEYEEEEEEEDESEEGENQRTNTLKKKVSRSKAFACKVRNRHDHFGVDIFKSGRATQPKNPYFVAKIRSKRRDQLYVPVDVVKDYKLELPSSMTIRDSVGREFVTKLKKWKDGRIWLVGGWRSLCRWNLVEKNDHCICEFVRGKCNKDLHLQVQVLHEGASSIIC
ncbi:hypothetical protein RDI58_003312 [Solanum bulbocastanum]|uniref:TF-B3 domain-containing protein n=1 Tax=Solanum bulbocastanum TaxID=147425 RepID=A0AAN8UHD4_SOLBU